MNNGKRIEYFDCIFISIIMITTLIILGMVLFADYDEFEPLHPSMGQKAITYSELKAYETELKEEIKKYKEERAEKVDQLAKLDKEYAELEAQYEELLKQKKLISDKLAKLYMEKGLQKRAVAQ